MTTRAFRFGVVAGPARSGEEWLDQARAAEAAGYDTLLLPDTRYTPSPFPALAAAGAVTSTLRLGTWVLAGPLHHPAATARDSAALQLLTGGRFELGVGTGRPDAAQEAEQLGVAWGTGPERIRRVTEIIDAVRAQVRPAPAVLVAGSGPTILAVAGRTADTVGLAVPPTADVDAVARAADLARQAGDPEIALQLSGVAGQLVPYLARQGHPPEAFATAAGVLTGDAAAMAESLDRLRRRTGVSYVSVSADHASAFAPVIPLLRAERP